LDAGNIHIVGETAAGLTTNSSLMPTFGTLASLTKHARSNKAVRGLRDSN